MIGQTSKILGDRHENDEIDRLWRSIGRVEDAASKVGRQITVTQGGSVVETPPEEQQIQNPGEELYWRFWHQEGQIANYPINTWVEFPLFTPQPDSCWMVLNAWLYLENPFSFDGDVTVSMREIFQPLSQDAFGNYTNLFRAFRIEDDDGEIVTYTPFDQKTQTRKILYRGPGEPAFNNAMSLFVRRTSGVIRPLLAKNEFHMLVNYRTPPNGPNPQ